MRQAAGVGNMPTEQPTATPLGRLIRNFRSSWPPSWRRRNVEVKNRIDLSHLDATIILRKPRPHA
jgi:hypothetical protein